jgi:TRAP-type C4-dicarboxylate transport system substrate-binding protein
LAVLLSSLVSAYGAAPEKITLKFVDQWKPDQYSTAKFLKVAEEIGKRSKGRLEIVRAGGSEVIPAPDQLNACGKGSIDIVFGWPVYYAGVVPEGQILGLPVTSWNFDNVLKLTNAVADDLDKIYQKKANVKLLFPAFTVGGVYSFTRAKLVTSVADMKGLRLRTPGGLDAVILEAMGAVPTRIASGEIYTAAERGIIDGASRPLQPVLDWKEYEIWKHFVTTPSSTQVMGSVWMGLNAFNKLPGDLQKFLVDVYKELAPDFITHFNNIEISAAKELANKGVKPVDLKPGEAEKWLSIPSKPSEEYFLKQSPQYGKLLIDKVRAAAK